MKRRKVTQNTPAAKAVAGRNEHLRKAKQNMAENAARLKKEIAVIKEQTLQTLRQSTQTVFKENNTANLQQIAARQQEVLTESRRTGPSDATGPAGSPASNPESFAETVPERMDAGKYAMDIANKGAKQALESAKLGFAEVKKMMGNLKKRKKG